MSFAGARPSDELVALVGRHLDLTDVVAMTLMHGGDVNESALVELSDGARLVARRRLDLPSPFLPDVAGQVTAHRMARQQGVPVPDVVAFDDGGMLYRYVTGVPVGPGVAVARPAGALEPPPISPAVARQAGEAYGRLHTRHGTGFGPVQVDGGHAGWAASVYFDLLPGLAERVLALQPDDLGLRRTAVERSVELAMRHFTTPRCRHIHGDASPANTIVDATGSLAAVIDFDATQWYDPASDLAWWWYHAPGSAPDFIAGCATSSEPTDELTVLIYRARLLIGLAAALGATDPPQTARIGALLADTVTRLAGV